MNNFLMLLLIVGLSLLCLLMFGEHVRDIQQTHPLVFLWGSLAFVGSVMVTGVTHGLYSARSKRVFNPWIYLLIVGCFLIFFFSCFVKEEQYHALSAWAFSQVPLPVGVFFVGAIFSGVGTLGAKISAFMVLSMIWIIKTINPHAMIDVSFVSKVACHS